MRTIGLLSGALILTGAMMAGTAGAAELKVVSAEAMKPALQELAPKFEAASKHKLVIAYAPGAAGEKEVASDDTVDIAILPKDSIDNLIKSARILTFPKELAKGTNPDVVYVVGSSLVTEEPLAAKALMDFLASPEAKKVYEAKGLKQAEMVGPGRLALVTGASAGMGLETALGLARAGFHVVMAGRDAARTEHARAAVIERLGNGRSESDRVSIVLADFASLAAVRSVADAVLTRHDRLDVLVNNAGIIAPRYQLSQDGYELTVAVNHLAPFLLTNLLLDRLRASASPSMPGRIVTVASQAHRGAWLDLGRWMDWDGWSPLRAYGRSKLCNILCTRALARRLTDGSVVAAALHPGVIATKIGDSAGSVVGLGWRLAKPFFASAEKGARTTLFLATTPDPARFHGAYLIDSKPAEPDPAARDDDMAERLWAESSRLVGL